jgi:hypothetical protein
MGTFYSEWLVTLINLSSIFIYSSPILKYMGENTPGGTGTGKIVVANA